MVADDEDGYRKMVDDDEDSCRKNAMVLASESGVRPCCFSNFHLPPRAVRTHSTDSRALFSVISRVWSPESGHQKAEKKNMVWIIELWSQPLPALEILTEVMFDS